MRRSRIAFAALSLAVLLALALSACGPAVKNIPPPPSPNPSATAAGPPPIWLRYKVARVALDCEVTKPVGLWYTRTTEYVADYVIAQATESNKVQQVYLVLLNGRFRVPASYLPDAQQPYPATWLFFTVDTKTRRLGSFGADSTRPDTRVADPLTAFRLPTH
jgi:hypothetical protein